MTIRLTVIARGAYPAIRPHSGSAVGGRETFIWGLAAGIANSSPCRVQLVIGDTSAPASEEVHGVEVVNILDGLDSLRENASQSIRRSPRFPGIQIREWGLSLLWKIPVLAVWKIRFQLKPLAGWLAKLFQENHTDIALVRGVNQDTAAVVKAARKSGAAFIVWLGSNADIDRRYFDDPGYRDPYGVSASDVRTTLEGADVILCQTGWQDDALKSIPSVQHIPRKVIHNPVNFHRFHPGDATYQTRQHVLWVGRYDEFHKRPLLGMEVARRCPDVPFLFVINEGREGVEERVRDACPKNVSIVDYIPNDQMPQAYRNARLFLSTGSLKYEGFPNVMLEAAASGTPTASLEDFDQFLEKSAAGVCGFGQVEPLALAIKELWNDEQRWQACSDAGVAYVRKHHSMDAIRDQFLSLVTELVERKKREGESGLSTDSSSL